MKKKASNKRGRDYEIPMVLHEPVEFDMAADMKAGKKPPEQAVDRASPAVETFGGDFHRFESVFRPKKASSKQDKRKARPNGAKRKKKASAADFLTVLARVARKRARKKIELKGKLVKGELRFEPSADLAVRGNEILVGDQKIVVKVT